MEQLEGFVSDIIKTKNATLDKDVLEELTKDMLQRLINQINRDLINALPDEYVDEINLALDKGDADKVQQIINESGINQQALMARTMINFRQQYIG